MESIGIEPILFACKAKDLPINLWSLVKFSIFILNRCTPTLWL